MRTPEQEKGEWYMDKMPGEKSDELWDLYTKDREKTGETHRRADALPKGKYHLAVHICIFNSRNQLLIQQRQPFKKDWPNMWDVSAAGSAVAGDNSRQAAQREVFEELGLEIDFSDTRPFFTMNFSGGFDDFYLIRQDVDITKLRLQEEEVQRVKWADKDEVIKMQAQGIMIPYWFLDRFFDIRDSYDDEGERIHKITAGFAGLGHLEPWMNFAEIIRSSFPGMETEQAMDSYCDTVISHMKNGSAVYAADGRMIIGVLLFLKEESKIGCLAVHPEYRRRGIAKQMLQLMMTKLDESRAVTVETFREDDKRGAQARAFYQSLGFVPGQTGMFQGYPVQVFTLREGSSLCK